MLGMYALPTTPTVGAIFTDTAFREQCVVLTIWMVYVTDPTHGLFTHFQDLAGRCDLLVLQPPRQALEIS